MPTFLDIPAVWRGDELLSREDWSHTLTPEHHSEIDAALDGARDLSPEELAPDNFLLPGLAPKLKQVQENLETGSGACMIRGLDLARWTEEDAKIVFLGITSHIGTTISQSAAGDTVFSVRDAGFKDDDPRARGPNTSKKLSFHTDRCDVIAFLCLNQAKSGGENEVVSSAMLYNEIAYRRPDLLDVLMQPYLYKRHTVDTGNALKYCRQPIFSFCEGHFACAFLRVLIERAHADPEAQRMTAVQKEALDFLEEVAAEPGMQVRFSQEPGDLLLLNNWVTLHRRTAFEDYMEPKRRRHILRIWLSVPNNRPLDPLFKDNYGAVEAGAIRGGMKQSGAGF